MNVRKKLSIVIVGRFHFLSSMRHPALIHCQCKTFQYKRNNISSERSPCRTNMMKKIAFFLNLWEKWMSEEKEKEGNPQNLIIAL